jgi:hypothetical protein
MPSDACALRGVKNCCDLVVSKKCPNWLGSALAAVYILDLRPSGACAQRGCRKMVAARPTRRLSLTDGFCLRQRFISRILGPSGVCTQGGCRELLWFSVKISWKETEGSQLRQRVILVFWLCRVAPLYYSPCARLRIRLAKLRFNKLVKSAKRQLPVFYWAVGYIAYSAFLAPTLLRPERGELSLPLIGPRDRPPSNQKILR